MDDLHSSPAELMYGERLRLLGKFISQPETYITSEDRCELQKLMFHVMCWQVQFQFPFFGHWDNTHISQRIFSKLNRCLFAEILLSPLSLAPIKALFEYYKELIIERKNRYDSVFIDRLKPVYPT